MHTAIFFSKLPGRHLSASCVEELDHFCPLVTDFSFLNILFLRFTHVVSCDTISFKAKEYFILCTDHDFLFFIFITITNIYIFIVCVNCIQNDVAIQNTYLDHIHFWD